MKCDYSTDNRRDYENHTRKTPVFQTKGVQTRANDCGEAFLTSISMLTEEVYKDTRY
jgi:hypothetical protein